MKNYKLKINGNDYTVDINEVEGQDVKLSVNGTPYVVTVDQEIKQQKKTVVSSPRPQIVMFSPFARTHPFTTAPSAR
ncbi:MAG: hypothetical protein IKX32_02455 [Bacteroidales bacterium]|nr:hypothetical protein [Bacteroidales bacterium]